MLDEFCDIYTFEESVIKYNKNQHNLYILSKEFDQIKPKGILLTRLSIFDDIERGTIKNDKEKVSEILKILMSSENPQAKSLLISKLNISDKEKRSIGSMLGMVIGDAMGAINEFKSVRYDKKDTFGMGAGGNFYLKPCQWTDDTSMGICLADSLLMNKGELNQHDLMKRFIAWWKGGYNNAFRFCIENEKKYPRGSVGLGGNISLSLSLYIKEYRTTGNPSPETKAGNKNTSGNGSIMRNAAVPICFNKDINKACEVAKRQSLVTHQGVEAKECCSLLTNIIVQILNGEKLEKIFENLEKRFKSDVKSVEKLAKHEQEGYDENRNWNWKVPQYYYSPQRSKKMPGYIGSYCMDAMAMSLNIVYTTNNFRDAIIKSVNLRGDSDSVSSVVGQIVGAYYPLEEIPGEWIREVFKWDHGEIALRGYMLARLKEGKSYII